MGETKDGSTETEWNEEECDAAATSSIYLPFPISTRPHRLLLIPFSHSAGSIFPRLSLSNQIALSFPKMRKVH